MDLVLTRAGTKGDACHRRAWEFLARQPELLEEYRVLKLDRSNYEARKAEFFDRVVTLMEAARD